MILNLRQNKLGQKIIAPAAACWRGKLLPFSLTTATLTCLELLSCLVVLLGSGVVAADSLDEVLSSETIQKYSSPSTARTIDTTRYSESFPKKSGYAQLFVEQDGITLVGKWLGVNAQGSSLKTVSAWRTQEFLRVIFQTALNKEPVVVKVLIPDPNHQDLVKYGALREFAALSPPLLKVVRQKPVPGKHLSGTLYAEEDGTCSIVFKLPQYARLVVKTSCTMENSLVKFALHLPLLKLAQKLGK